MKFIVLYVVYKVNDQPYITNLLLSVTYCPLEMKRVIKHLEISFINESSHIQLTISKLEYKYLSQ